MEFPGRSVTRTMPNHLHTLNSNIREIPIKKLHPESRNSIVAYKGICDIWPSVTTSFLVPRPDLCMVTARRRISPHMRVCLGWIVLYITVIGIEQSKLDKFGGNIKDSKEFRIRIHSALDAVTLFSSPPRGGSRTSFTKVGFNFRSKYK